MVGHNNWVTGTLLSPQVYVMVALAMSLSFLAGCATFNAINPLGAAQSAEQKAFASYGTYVIFQERAVDIVRDRSISVKLRQRVQQVDKIVKPAADLVLVSARKLIQARSVYEAGVDNKDQVLVLVDQLNGALTALQPKLQAFIVAVQNVDREK